MQLEEANQALRDAVAQRLADTPADDDKLIGYVPRAADEPITPDPVEVPIPCDWILQGERELKEHRLRGDSLLASESVTPRVYGQTLRPGSAEFLAVLEELKELHLRKTLDYGVDEDALSNIRSSADIVNMPAWAGCVLRMMDKMHRLKAYFRRGRCEFDGLSDTLKDLACYAVIAEVLRRESDGQTPCG